MLEFKVSTISGLALSFCSKSVFKNCKVSLIKLIFSEIICSVFFRLEITDCSRLLLLISWLSVIFIFAFSISPSTSSKFCFKRVKLPSFSSRLDLIRFRLSVRVVNFSSTFFVYWEVFPENNSSSFSRFDFKFSSSIT